MRILAMIMLACLTASAAAASDRVGYKEIAAGDFAAAAQRLEAERRIHPQRPELMLNLAAAYTRLGRPDDARALYASVLARPIAKVDLPDGSTTSSHDVATRGMSRLTTTIAAR